MYNASLQDWAQQYDVQLPTIPAHCEQAYHMFYMILPSLDLRQKLIMYLRECGIYSVFHYLPLHLSDMGRRFGGKLGDCPVTEKVSDQLVRLPGDIRAVLKLDPQILGIAQKFRDKGHFLFIGRHVGYPVALEGALKLKELAYMHAEGFAAGELKHGPLALVDEDMPVIAVAPRSR